MRSNHCVAAVNAALPLNEAKDKGGAERYPATRQDDSVETGEQRSFNPTPKQGAGDGGPSGEDLTGPAGDPVEGKR